MRDLLTRQGYDVLIAGDAPRPPRDHAPVRQPDLVLLDVIMPGKSGYELCREWKDAPETRLIPVVMITGLSDLEDKIRGIEAGADDFLNKPIFPVELFARVASLLRVKELHRRVGERRHRAVHPRTQRRVARSLHRRPLRAPGRLRQRARALPRPGRRGSAGAAPRRLSARPGKDRHRRRDSEQAGTAYARRMAASCVSIRSSGKTSASRCARCAWCCPSFATTTSTGTAAATRTTWPARTIPLLARVLQVVDVYDALRTERPYKPAHSYQSARETMLAEAALRPLGRGDRARVLLHDGAARDAA